MGSSLIFASHPVHVESVVAVVNIAEPLCCIFFCLAYMLYWLTYDIACGYHSSQGFAFTNLKKSWTLNSIWVGVLLLSMVYVVVAILFKETGITILGMVVGTSVLALLSHWIRKTFRLQKYYPTHAPYSGNHTSGSRERSGGKAVICTSTNVNCNCLEGTKSWYINHVAWIGLAVVVLVGYFVFRAYLVSEIPSVDIDSLSTTCRQGALTTFMDMTRDTLSMLYGIVIRPFFPSILGETGRSTASFYLDESQLIRKAENPFAFLDREEKVLSLLYLHFRYFFLLLWPIELSAEYAFDCIPKVSDWHDNGNYRVYNACAMYAFLFAVGVWGFYRMVYRPPSRVRSEAVLISLMFLVVPFIPASGVFLRLGTLLAERLLYIPSIGFCYLLCVMLLEISHPVCAVVQTLWHKIFRKGSSLRSQHFRRRYMFVYWGVLLPILYFYSARTIYRNRDWADDATLFTAALNVCPRSAKLRLQLAKMYINEGDYKTAEQHITIAKDIDPDFCDVGYQEALLNIVYYHDTDAAVEKLSESLHCAFTLTEAWKLLSNIWESQIKQSPGDFRVLEGIGNVCHKAGLYVMAVRQYQQATSAAFDQSKYLSALKLSVKAEKSLRNLFLEQYSDSLHGSELNSTLSLGMPDASVIATAGRKHELSWDTYRELECNTYSLGGVVRNVMYEKYVKASNPNDKKSKKTGSSKPLSSSILAEVNRAKQLMRMGIRPVCVFPIHNSGSEDYTLQNSVAGYPRVLIGTLSTRLASEYQAVLAEQRASISSLSDSLLREGADKMRELAEFTLDAARAYAQMYRVFSDVIGAELAESISGLGSQQIKELNLIHDQLGEALTSSLKFWVDAGEAYFKQQEYVHAQECFYQAITFDHLVEDDLEVDMGQSHLKSSCAVRYWYAHALAGEEGFALDSGRIRKAINLLEDTLSCAESGRDRTVTAEMKKLSTTQLTELKAHLEYLELASL
eukprot:CAMPEP_0185035494 /NCGR_PEP_ID=MMETSP1103-20130426/26972_1 /TAXON_ID=36769 /ORGANISM="Paraphysomonas bandaiensis, Strain Caron Lab Isolate" /LENGTH=963 /DNA_ID=CAMNT_0027572601 /DNA_START=413 /DNA_END=3304 /DNA_ORIENTATION=-